MPLMFEVWKHMFLLPSTQDFKTNQFTR